jgi:hypothetical protein
VRCPAACSSAVPHGPATGAATIKGMSPRGSVGGGCLSPSLVLQNMLLHYGLSPPLSAGLRRAAGAAPVRAGEPLPRRQGQGPPRLCPRPPWPPLLVGPPTGESGLGPARAWPRPGKEATPAAPGRATRWRAGAGGCASRKRPRHGRVWPIAGAEALGCSGTSTARGRAVACLCARVAAAGAPARRRRWRRPAAGGRERGPRQEELGNPNCLPTSYRPQMGWLFWPISTRIIFFG